MSPYDAYFRHYPRTHPACVVARRSARFIRREAETRFGGRLLDIGCGSKWKQDLVGDLVDEYVGLDHEGSMHDQSVVDIFGTAYEIPQPDASFDCILCTSVLEHLEEPGAALRESARVLRPGGFALYTTPLFWHLHEQPRDFYRYTEYSLRYLFESAGYEVVTLEAMSGFWLTVLTELGYYTLASLPRLLRPALRPLLAVGSYVIPAVDRVDTRINPRSTEWTWMYVVVARRSA
jgi:SAM-dependent methyltransferase